jgi:hypothetical protein
MPKTLRWYAIGIPTVWSTLKVACGILRRYAIGIPTVWSMLKVAYGTLRGYAIWHTCRISILKDGIPRYLEGMPFGIPAEFP